MNTPTKALPRFSRTGGILTTLIVTLVLAFYGTAGAAVATKAATGTDLTAAASWDTLPGSGDVATWASTSLGASLTMGTAQSWQGIDVQGALTAIGVTGAGTLTLDTSGINIASGGQNLTYTTSITLGANQNWTVGSGRTLTVCNAAGKILTLDNKLTLDGAGQVNLGGSGATTLTGNGEIEVSSGILQNNMQTGSSATGRSGATTLSGGNISIATSISMFGTGAINLNSGGIGSFSGTSRDLGTANTVNIGGNIQIGGSSGGLSTGAVRFGGATDLGGSVRTITAIASAVLTGNGAGAIFNGVVSNGGITKEGAGYITLGNNGNTFTGPTTINAGNLAFSQKALANSTSVTLANSGVWLVIGENGAGTHDINNLSGVSGSIIRSDFSITGTTTARALKITQSTDGTFAGTFIEGSSGRTISLEKAGNATLTLSGTGGYTAGTTVSAGTLQLGGSSATVAGTGAIQVDSVLEFNNSGAVNAFANNLTGSGTISKIGTQDLGLTGNNTFSGQVNITGGKLAFSGVNSAAGAPKVNVASSATMSLGNGFVGGTLNLSELQGSGLIDTQFGSTDGIRTLNINQSTTTTFSGTMQDATSGSRILALTKSGAGVLTLSGPNTYTGDTDVQAGTLTLADGGQLSFRIGANGVNNQLKGSGTVNLDGAFVFDLSGAAIANGNSWNIVNVGTLAETYGGTFQVPSPFSETSAGVWTWAHGPHNTWTFTEATGVLGLAVGNNPPGAQDITMGVNQGGSATLLIVGGKHAPADSDGDTLTVSLPSATTTNGAAVSTDGSSVTVDYSGVSSFSGTDGFEYTVSDGYGGTVTKSIIVMVSAGGNGANITGLTGTVPNITIHFAGMPSSPYAIERASSPSGPWSEIAASVATDTHGQGSYLDTSAPSPSGYYRTRHVSTP